MDTQVDSLPHGSRMQSCDPQRSSRTCLDSNVWSLINHRPPTHLELTFVRSGFGPFLPPPSQLMFLFTDLARGSWTTRVFCLYLIILRTSLSLLLSFASQPLFCFCLCLSLLSFIGTFTPPTNGTHPSPFLGWPTFTGKVCPPCIE